jgi:hypothetical protein
MKFLCDGGETGEVCAIQGWVTGTIPAFLLLIGQYSGNENIVAITLAVFGVIVFGLLYPRLRADTQVPPPQSTVSRRAARADGHDER